MAIAYFAAGCFWGIQEAFDAIPGVTETRVGYMGGTTKNPHYEQVCSGTTGHAETVEVQYNPRKISYKSLLQHFLQMHNPGQKQKRQYSSIVFYTTLHEKKIAEQLLPKAYATVEAAATFYPAEDYHQKYYQKQLFAHNGVKA